MIRSRLAGALPRRLVLVAAAALIPVLAGCEAGNNAPTLSFHPPTAGAGTVVGKLSIRNVFVLGAPLGKQLGKGAAASVFLALVNNGNPDRLVSVSAPGTATSVTLPAGGIPVVVHHPVYSPGPTAPVALEGLVRPLASGSFISLVLHFQKAGPVRLLVPVLPRAGAFASLSPPVTPQTLAPYASPSGVSGTAAPTSSATPAPSAS